MTPVGDALRVGMDARFMEVVHWDGTGRVFSATLPHLSKSVSLKPVHRARRGAITERPDVDAWLAHGHEGALGVREPVVSVVHEAGWDSPEARSYLGPPMGAVVAAGTASAMLEAAHVLVPSKAARTPVSTYYGVEPDRLHVVPYGVDLGTFRPDRRGGRQMVAEAMGRDVPYVLYVATLSPRKNLPTLRHAIARLAHRGLPHVLVIVARDPLDRPDWLELRYQAEAELPGAPDRILSMARLRDDAVILKRDEYNVLPREDAEIAMLMADADAVCLPSFFEGFGLTALEALASGAPLVASDRGSLPEVVGEAALLVEPTVDAVELALARVLGDPRLAERLRHDGRRQAERFTWERTAAGWLTVLEQAANDQRAMTTARSPRRY